MKFFTSFTNLYLWIISDKCHTALAINGEGMVFRTPVRGDTFNHPGYTALELPQVIEWLGERDLTLDDLWERK